MSDDVEPPITILGLLPLITGLPAGPSSFTHLSNVARLLATPGVLTGGVAATSVSACGSIASEPYTLTFDVSEPSGLTPVTKKLSRNTPVVSSKASRYIPTPPPPPPPPPWMIYTTRILITWLPTMSGWNEAEPGRLA